MEPNSAGETATANSNEYYVESPQSSLTAPLRNESLPGGIMRIADIYGLTKAMLCSGCGKIPVPPKIAACTEGHLICGPCVRSFGRSGPGRCPRMVESENKAMKNCGGQIGKYKCHVYEYLYHNSEFRCTYADAGCRKTPMGSKVKEHEHNCPYRPTIPCPFSSCPSGLVSQFTLLKHLVSVHNVSPLDSDTLRVQVLDERANAPLPAKRQDSYRWLCALLSCHDLNFMLMAEERNGGMYMWASLATGAGLVNGRKFQCNISLVPENNFSSQGLSWEGDVYPLEETFENIVSEEDTLLIKKAALSKKYIFMSETEELFVWNVDVCIKETLFQGISLTMGVDGSSRNTSPRSSGILQGSGTGDSSQDVPTDQYIRFGLAPSAPPPIVYESPKSEPLILDSAYEESSPGQDQKELASPKSTVIRSPELEFEIDEYQEISSEVKPVRGSRKPQPLPRTRRGQGSWVQFDEAEQDDDSESDMTIMMDNNEAEATTPEPEESPELDSPRPMENPFLTTASAVQYSRNRTGQNTSDPTPTPTTTQEPRRRILVANDPMQELQDLISRVDFSHYRHN